MYPFEKYFKNLILYLIIPRCSDEVVTKTTVQFLISIVGGTKMRDFISCFACGAKSLNIEGECHKYMLAAPGCWIMFNEVLAKEYSDFRYSKAHQFTVDAYACQHIGIKEDKSAVNSVNIHLASLYLMCEEGMDWNGAPQFRQAFSQYYKNNNILEWLTPPKSFGEYTIYDIWENKDPNAHFNLSQKWAKAVWDAWKHQHQRIRHLVHQVKK